jgi:hypothetical protein
MAYILSHSAAKPQAAAKMTTGSTTKAKSSMAYPALRHVIYPEANIGVLIHIKSIWIFAMRHKNSIKKWADDDGRKTLPFMIRAEFPHRDFMHPAPM